MFLLYPEVIWSQRLRVQCREGTVRVIGEVLSHSIIQEVVENRYIRFNFSSKTIVDYSMLYLGPMYLGKPLYQP